MRRTFQSYVILSIVLVVGGLDIPQSCAETPEPKAKLTVRVYNYAQVPAGILAQAEQQTAGIFRLAGIKLAWVDCPVSREEIEKFPVCTQMRKDRQALTLKILPESMAAGYALPITNLGVTIQHHASFVFYHRVQLLSNDKALSEPVVLGHIIAHELGHLLLGEGGHSESGIMKEDLRVNDFRQAEKGRSLTFSTEQAQRMQSRLRERSPLYHRPMAEYPATSLSDSC